MKNKKILKELMTVALFFVAMNSILQAEEKAAQKNIKELELVLSTLMPQTKPTSIVETQIPGMFEVSYGPTIFYFSQDGSHMFRGDLIDVNKKINITEKKRSNARIEMINALGEENMIVYRAKDEKSVVTVFTDIDCPYCVKLHREMDKYNAAGITVRYMAFPRAGIGSPSFEKAVSVWCADDKKAAITKAKSGDSVEKKTCENPVAQEYQLGQIIGVKGTPALFLQDGSILPGYVSAEKLSQIIKEL